MSRQTGGWKGPAREAGGPSRAAAGHTTPGSPDPPGLGCVTGLHDEDKEKHRAAPRSLPTPTFLPLQERVDVTGVNPRLQPLPYYVQKQAASPLNLASTPWQTGPSVSKRSRLSDGASLGSARLRGQVPVSAVSIPPPGPLAAALVAQGAQEPP